MDYLITESRPAVEEYLRLREVTGLSPKSPDAAKAGLQGTILAVCVRSDEELVGMGRIIGDGGCFFQIVDVAVHPDHQRRGLGRRILESLMHRLKLAAPRTAYVSLIADGDARHLYSKFGFAPTAPGSIGMAQHL